jgi:hypothetical protein
MMKITIKTFIRFSTFYYNNGDLTEKGKLCGTYATNWEHDDRTQNFGPRNLFLQPADVAVDCSIVLKTDLRGIWFQMFHCFSAQIQ